MSGDPESAGDILRCYLAGLAFRFRHVTDGTSAEFGDIDAGNGVRVPREIVRHMTGLVLLAHDQFEEKAGGVLQPLAWQEERERFIDAVWTFYRVTETGDRLRPGRRMASLAQVWHGPLTDLMTHVGQLATLRRLAGDPVEPIRYWQAEPPGPPDIEH
ncbi:MAG: hypothetical protein WD314_14880 [Trueperaceae bacterium]